MAMQPQESAAGFVSVHACIHFSRQWCSCISFCVLHLVQFPGADQSAGSQSDMFYGGFGTERTSKFQCLTAG